MVHTWSLVSACLLVTSTFATLLTTLHLRFRWDVTASSIRWLFWFFFLWVFVWCFVRSIYFVWMVSIPDFDVVKDNKGRLWTSSQLDRLGIHGVLAVHEVRETWLTLVLCIGDLALCGVALTLFPLTYELWRLAKKSMDRGVEKERQMIRLHCAIVSVGVVVFGATQLGLVVSYGGYDIHTYRCALFVYTIQFAGMAFMAGLLITLKVSGRKYETIHGTFVESPLYKRLRNIMLVYANFCFVFELSAVIINLYTEIPQEGVIDFIGVSLVFYNASGLMLSITTSCSQACVFSACRHCLPDGFEAEMMHQRFTIPKDEDLEAPSVNPIFVFTDIESSTSLWNLDSTVMTAATEIHDRILRETLIKHRGYEITTVGDAFHVAFRTISDAIEYCLDVQLQLLLAEWPEGLEEASPATQKHRIKNRLVFSGLRVRMGIHDASESDGGALVQHVHPVTGKVVYSGVSEVIADFVGDLGSGGQILVTKRVAAWLRHHRDDLSVDVFMEFVGNYAVPQMNTSVDIYQLQPALLASRTQLFPAPVAKPQQPQSVQRGPSSRFLFGRGTLTTLVSASSEDSDTQTESTPDASRIA